LPADRPWGRARRACAAFVYLAQPLFCTPEVAADDRKKLALLRLFNALGESAGLRAHPDAGVTAFVEALAAAIGVAPETSPLIQAKLAAAALVEDGKRSVVALAGPRLAGFFEAAYKHQNYNTRKYVQEHADLSAIDALSPEERALTLFDCLRVFNFAGRSWKLSRAKAWPDAKLTNFDQTAFPNLGKYATEVFSTQVLDQLFTALARKKMTLSEPMQRELLALLRSDVAPNMLRTLQVVKIIEGFAKRNSSPGVRKELEAAIAALREANGHDARKFKASAMHRLEAALASMAASQAQGAAGQPGAAASAVQRIPGVFGKRPAADMPPATLPPEASDENGPLPLPEIPDQLWKGIHAVSEFYGDLGDLRKCAPEHIAFMEELIQRDADPQAGLLREIEKEIKALRAQGYKRDVLEAAGQMKALEAGGRLRAGMNRALLDLLKARMQVVAGLAAEAKTVWPLFHAHARRLYEKSRPGVAWLNEAHAILDRIGPDDRIALVKAAVQGFLLGRFHLLPTDETLRGLIYCGARLPVEAVGPLISDFARKECFQTVPGVGIRDQRMGNACLWTLINMPDGRGIPYLARLLNRIKYPSVKKTINAALDEAAARAGMSRGTLDELSVPTHELQDGRREIPLGESGGAAILEIVGAADVSVSFRRADGKVTASVPAELKELKAGIKEAKSAAKEIEADLATQIARLQRIYLENRDWSFADWTSRYAEHPLLAQLARRLIWDVTAEVGRTAAILVDGVLTDVAGNPVAVEDRRIALWHPIGKPVAEVLAWRRRLTALRIVQPLKQAHREVYYVTDAERATGVYSNRFAGHILRQHQMMTLARLNHWNVTHRIWADVRNDEPTHLVLPAWNIVAEFWTEGTGGDSPETTDSQAYTYLSTDQVRFYRISDEAAKAPPTARGPERGEAIRMEAAPEIVFSEVMRCCDLFTSVASVGNDPNWMDAGANAEHPDQWRRTVGADYWRNAALGDLGASAASRKEVITELLPALKIADRCRIDGNYLRVEGKLRTYKIHFGSGNILMEPDSRYLCIVKATPKSQGMVMLPFEGDGMLSVIVSKAFMLAADDKISEQQIVRQIVR
jgi:hypothetical protein